MKFKIVRSRFLEGLKDVQNIISGKGSLPILQNVLIEAKGKDISLTTTDLDISIQSVCECSVEECGATTLPVKLLFNAITKVPEGEVEIDIDAKNKATISTGNVRYKIAGIDENEFPRISKDENTFSYVIPQATFKEMLKRVFYAASQDDTRRTLKGVLVSFKESKLTVVATDGRRLALVTNELEFPKAAEKDIVLPSKTVTELLRSLVGEEPIQMSIQKTQICFHVGNKIIYSKVMDDTYPNYKQVIPKETKEHIKIDRQLLLDALERVSVMTMDEAHSTKLIFDNGKLTVSSSASDIGEAKDIVPIKYAGEKIEIMFNPTYVMDPLKAIDEDQIMVNINDGQSPAVITSGVPFLYVLMPLRIS